MGAWMWVDWRRFGSHHQDWDSLGSPPISLWSGWFRVTVVGFRCNLSVIRARCFLAKQLRSVLENRKPANGSISTVCQEGVLVRSLKLNEIKHSRTTHKTNSL